MKNSGFNGANTKEMDANNHVLHFAVNIFVRLFFLVLLYTVMRLVFLAFNWDAFRTVYFYVSRDNILAILLGGFRFDLSVILFLNFPVILLYFSPFKGGLDIYLERMEAVLFVVINSLALLLSVGDTLYYMHALERTTGELLGVLDGLFLMFIKYSFEYWYAWIFFLLGVSMIIYIYGRTKITGQSALSFTKKCMLFVSMMFLCSISYFQLKAPLNPMPSAVVTNSPFVFINSLLGGSIFYGHKKPNVGSFFTPYELDEILNPHRSYFNPDLDTEKYNVVVLVLESFSKEFVGFLNDRDKVNSYTPFLDSLSEHSLIFTNAYANGKHTNEAIPAIFASIPKLMDGAFITSRYRNNRINGLGSILKKQGYSSAFFHGSPDGMYGLDFFAKQAGFDQYHGKKEYGNNKYYDGSWGIWDDRFFDYTVHQMDRLQEPFITGLLSISSHHPFELPSYYQDEGDYPHPFLKCVRYTDNSLKQFFASAMEKKWFHNTLFIITADHTANVNFRTSTTYSPIGKYQIPLMFYKTGGEILGVENSLTQQIDIIPSILDLLNIDYGYTGLGKSFRDKGKERYVFQYQRGNYQIINKDYLVNFDGQNIISHISLTDSLEKVININKHLSENLSGHEAYIKAAVQWYGRALIEDLLVTELD